MTTRRRNEFVPDPGSERGAATQSGGPTRLGAILGGTTEDLVARSRALAQTAPATTAPTRTSLDGEALEFEVAHCKVPLQYRRARWERLPAGVDGHLARWTSDMDAMISQGRTLVMVGPTGTGKSCAAALVLRRAVAAGWRALWTYVPDLVDEIGERYTRREIVGAQTAIDLLVWDDFGVTNMTEWQVGQLDRIVERRYNARKPMVITTNMNQDQLRAPALNRMTDRWMERGGVLKLLGESRRGQEE